MAAFFSQKFRPGTVGSQGESLARSYYQGRGLRIVVSNLINSRGKRIGEIDFIACSDTSVHFVEVKTRCGLSRFGSGREAVDAFKQRKLLKLAQWFLVKYPGFRELRPQIDVCLVELSSLDKSQFSVTIIPHAVSDLF